MRAVTQSAVTMAGGVAASVTTEPLIGWPTRGGLPAGLLSETGQVRLRGADVGLGSEPANDFVTDCARNTEGLKPDRELREDWGLNDDDWARLAENAPLLSAIKAERERRIRSGEAAREAAQRHFAKAPAILNAILTNETLSPRHRIEAAKELRQVVSSARENAATGEKFIIMIDLGEDCRLVKEFNQPARIHVDDGEAQ